MARWMALLCYFATLLFSERLASHDVVSILIWTGSVLSAVIGALHAGNSSDKIKKLDVGLNLLTTVSLFMALRYTSLSGFAISQVCNSYKNKTWRSNASRSLDTQLLEY